MTVCGAELETAEGRTLSICIRAPLHPGMHAGNGLTWLGASRLSSWGNRHAIVVTESRFECWEHCTGSEPHISEYRAADERPNG